MICSQNTARSNTFTVRFCTGVFLLVGMLVPPTTYAQMLGVEPRSEAPNPLSNPGQTPGKALLFELEARFAKATSEGGGRGFASFFASSAVTLGSGKAAVLGKEAIAANADWSPEVYHLTWKPDDARMGATGNMGFTWGHYEGRSKDKQGNPVVITGRYITVWEKQLDGQWKVLLDANNDEPPNAGDCCKLP